MSEAGTHATGGHPQPSGSPPVNRGSGGDPGRPGKAGPQPRA